METPTDAETSARRATNYVAVRAVANCASCGAEFRVARRGFQFSCPTCNWQPDGPLHEFWEVLGELARRVSNGRTPVDHRVRLRTVSDVEVQIHASPTSAACPWCGANLPDSEIASHLLGTKLRFVCTGCSSGVLIEDGMTWVKAAIPDLVFIFSTPAWIVAEHSSVATLLRCSSCGTTVSPENSIEGACPARCLRRAYHDWDFVLGIGQQLVAP
jgi:predicted RNA-binding Zn-ribbon protein involved in translation (DUF1610 family)